jgi:hypothetical protein
VTDEYSAGHTAGGIEARLAGHDKHFAAINGNLRDIAERLAILNMQIQRLADSADADRRTVVTTAAALKEAKEISDRASAHRWTPWQRAAVLMGAIAALATTLVLIVRLI